MQQSFIASLFVFFCIITSHLSSMDTPQESSMPLNVIEQATRDLATFIYDKEDSAYTADDINRFRSLITQGALLNSGNFYPLHDVVRYNQEAPTAYLLNAGAHVNRIQDNKTPLLLACKAHVDPSLMGLILQKGSYVNYQGVNGNTALHLLVLSLRKGASRQKVTDKTCHLLRAGISLTMVNDDGQNPNELLEKLNLSEESAGKIDTIKHLLTEGIQSESYKQWLEDLEQYEAGEKEDQAQRFEDHLTLSEEFKTGLYKPNARNVNRSDSCPEYPRFSMFTITE